MPEGLDALRLGSVNVVKPEGWEARKLGSQFIGELPNIQLLSSILCVFREICGSCIGQD